MIAFDRKRAELMNCLTFAAAGLPILFLLWSEAKLAMLQPVPGMSIPAFRTAIVQLLAGQLNLFASRRLLSETLELLFKRSRPNGTWPTLSEWLETIEGIRASAAGRLGQYREASLFALKQVFTELGPVLNHTSSNFMERLLGLHGVVLIVTSGLSVEMQSLLASLLMNWVYHSREAQDPDTLSPVCFLLDDALPLLRARGREAESESALNPIAEFSFMGRSRKMGIIASAQNFSLISSAFRNNADSLLCFASYGRDCEEIARHMNLTREQAALLPTLRPGSVVAQVRNIWPHAVFGTFPELP